MSSGGREEAIELVNLAAPHLEQVYDLVTAEDTIAQSFCGGVVPSDEEFMSLLWQTTMANLVAVDPLGDEVLAYARLAGGRPRDQFAEVFVAVPARWRGRGLGRATLEACRTAAGRRFGLRTLMGFAPEPFVAAFDPLVNDGSWTRSGVLRDHLYLLGTWSDVHVLTGRTTPDASATAGT